MLRPNITRFRSRLGYLMGKNYTIAELSKQFRVHRSQLNNMTKPRTDTITGSVSSKTLEKVIIGFVRIFRFYINDMTDKELMALITTELFSDIPPSRVCPTIREQNRTKKERAFEFKAFPGFDYDADKNSGS